MSYFDDIVGAFQAKLKKDLAAGLLEVLPKKEPDKPVHVPKGERGWSGDWCSLGETDVPAVEFLPDPGKPQVDYTLCPRLVFLISNQELKALGYTHFRFGRLSEALLHSWQLRGTTTGVSSIKEANEVWLWYLPDAYVPVPSRMRALKESDSIPFPDLDFQKYCQPSLVTSYEQNSSAWIDANTLAGSLVFNGASAGMQVSSKIPEGSLRDNNGVMEVYRNGNWSRYSVQLPDCNAPVVTGRFSASPGEFNYKFTGVVSYCNASEEYLRINPEKTKVSFDKGETWIDPHQVMFSQIYSYESKVAKAARAVGIFPSNPEGFFPWELLEFLRNQTPNGAEEKVQALARGTDPLFNSLYESKQDVGLVASNLSSPTNVQECATKVNLDSTGLPRGNLTLTVLKGHPEFSDGSLNISGSVDYSRPPTVYDNGNVK
jgi:hypothetical protein